MVTSGVGERPPRSGGVGGTNPGCKMSSRMCCTTQGIQLMFCGNWKVTFKNCVQIKTFLKSRKQRNEKTALP